VVGIIAIADEIRPGTRQAIASLKNSLGIPKIVMLTGNNAKVADLWAQSKTCFAAHDSQPVEGTLCVRIPRRRIVLPDGWSGMSRNHRRHRLAFL